MTLVTNGKTTKTYEAQIVGYNKDTGYEHHMDTVTLKKSTQLGNEQTTVSKKSPFVASQLHKNYNRKKLHRCNIHINYEFNIKYMHEEALKALPPS